MFKTSLKQFKEDYGLYSYPKELIEIPLLGKKSKYDVKKIRPVRLLGSDEKVQFKQRNDYLILYVPADRPAKFVAVFEVNGAL